MDMCQSFAFRNNIDYYLQLLSTRLLLHRILRINDSKLNLSTDMVAKA